MARQILPLAGSAVGSMLGPLGAQIGFAVGSLIGNAVDPLEVQGRKLGDAPTQVAAEGGARAIVFGKGCVRATVILERGGRRVVKKRHRSGKGGGPVTVNERALWTYAIGIGEAIPGGAIFRIWENEKLVYDVTPGSTIPEDTAAFAKLFRFYDGAEDQLPDPAIEAIYTDPTDAPYYRGTAYMVFPQRDLTDFGESVPTYRVEVASDIITHAIDRVGNIAANATGNVAGGISSNALTIDDTDFSTTSPNWSPYISGEYLNWQPLLMVEAFIHTGSQTPVRLQVIAEGGAVVADSGWIGDPELQSQLNANLTINGRADLSGLIVGYGTPGPGLMVSSPSSPGTSVWMELRLPEGTRLHKMRVYRSGRPTFATTGGAVLIHMPDPPSLPANAVAFSDVFGTYTSDEGYFATMWGSGTVTIEDSNAMLSSVVAAIHNRCGHEASDYNVTALTDMIDGVVIESTQTGAEAINSLIGTHWADPADYDGRIRYIKRGRPVVRTLTIDDLIDEPETWQRNNAIEYPAKMHFFGQIADLAYAQVKATSARYSADAKVVGEASVASPETFNTSQRPYEIAAILHKIMWTEAGGEVTWRVTDQHLDLVPTDCVGLSWAGQLWRARITQIEADPGELKLKMMLDRQSAYTANLTAIPIPPPVTPPQTSIVSDTALAVLDIPALVDAADDLHIVTAMSGETDAWAGGTLQRSLDAGASFATVSSSTLNAIMGTLQAPVTAASPHYTDTTNAVEVLLYTDDEIEAISEQAFRSEGGAFALSWMDSGTQRWELMQYRDAVLIAPKTYRLTTLHRGQLNTEAAAHPTNAVFVLLDGAIQAHPTQSAWIGQDLTHRAVSTGHTPDGADEQTLTYEGNSQREFPVAHLMLSRAGDDVTATAVPRHRFGTDDAPLRSLNWDGFRWTATDGTNTITRDGTAETETFDCAGWASPVTVTVAQLNRITGAGPSVSEGIA